MTLIKSLLRPLIIIGLVSFIIGLLFNLTGTLIVKYEYNGITGYAFSLENYLRNISNARPNDALNFEKIIPTRQFSENLDIGNNLLVCLNWLYFPINFILYVIRWFCWLILMLLSLIGWPVLKTGVDPNGITQYTSTLVTILNWIIEYLFIPYL